MNVSDQIKEIIISALHLENREINDDTLLLGAIPEFDSMAIVAVISEIEDAFGIDFQEHEISAEVFEKFGDLNKFVSDKLSRKQSDQH